LQLPLGLEETQQKGVIKLVNIATGRPYDWIKQIPGDLFQLDEIPLLGFSPPFPWDNFSDLLSRTFQVEGIKVKPSEMRWRAQEELFEEMGDNIKPLHCTVAPIESSICWIMSEKDVDRLLSLLFIRQKPPLEGIDPQVREAFYRFIAVEVVNAVEKSDFDKTLSATILSNTELPSRHALCLDIDISFLQETMRGRLVIPPEFRQSWKKRYLKQINNIYASPLSETLQVIVHLEGGRTHLKLSEWRSIQIGDFLILDSCTLDPSEDKGRIMLTVNGIPLFRGKIKQGNIKILEHPLYHEVHTTMNKHPSEEDEEEKEEEEEEFEDLDDELESEFGEESEEEEEEEPEIEEEEEEEFEDLEEFEEEIEEEEEKEEKKIPPELQGAPAKKAVAPGGGVEDIPLPVIIEVGRLQVSIKKLMELQPGNMLELDIHPEKGVDLVLNGKCIAKGELLRIGETLGVRILELS
jgi:flagellar motor switch protein FliN